MSAGPGPDDVVEAGPARSRLPEWRPFRGGASRGASVFAAAALVVGAAVGYAVGPRPGHGTAAPRPAVTVTATPSLPYRIRGSGGVFQNSLALTQDTPSCSTQTGHELQVGIEVTNQSGVPVLLQAAHAVLPVSGGLKAVSSQWATCGALPVGAAQGNVTILEPGENTWLTATLQVQVRCPRPYPVQFAVKYQVGGLPGAAVRPGFPDLGQVPYSGCSLSRGEQVADRGDPHHAPGRGREVRVDRHQGVGLQPGDRQVLGVPQGAPVAARRGPDAQAQDRDRRVSYSALARARRRAARCATPVRPG